MDEKESTKPVPEESASHQSTHAEPQTAGDENSSTGEANLSPAEARTGISSLPEESGTGTNNKPGKAGSQGIEVTTKNE